MAKRKHLPSGPPPSQRRGESGPPRRRLPEGAALRAELRKLDGFIAQQPRHFAALSLRALYLGLDDRWQEACRDVDEAIGLVPHGDPAELEILSLRAMVRRELGDLAGALADLDQLAGVKPNPPTLAARGEVHRRLGNVEDALADLNRSIGNSPEDPFAFIARGRVHLTEGRPGAAIADFESALRLDPDGITPFHHRAKARRAKGDRVGALVDWYSAVQLSRQRLARDPLDTRAMTWIAWINAHELQEDLPEALALMERVRANLDECERRIDFLEPMGLVQFHLGNLEEALRLLERAHEICPLDVEMQARLAKVRRAAGLGEA